MFQLTASYAHPENPDAFLAHYRGTHAPLALGFPKVRAFDWTICESADGSRPPHFLIAAVRWDSKDDALAALASPAGEAAVADLANFAGAGVDIDLGEVNVEL
ncbi:MAG: EthD family reductase [Sciscionella sp.]